MSTKINPPSYNPKIKSYELYKQELLAWKEITELDKKKQGVAIALSLPENDESRIREKVFDQVKLEDLKSETGLTILIEFLDKHLAKDDLADSLEKFEDFEDFRRSDGQSVNEYISIFDAKYRKIEKKNMKLPPEILAFKLLRRSLISKEEKMIVLTGMNFENKETLYEEAKKSLKKFKGEACEGNSTSTPVSIKLEPAFLAENEEALMAAGYTRMKGNKFYQRGGKSDLMRGRGFQSRGSYGNQHGRQPLTGSSALKKSMNPSGLDGNVLTCKSCGSFRHMMATCPHSWENMAKVNACSAEEEEFVLFTGYQPKEIRHLGMDARNCAVLDSACSSTVCGSTWISTYIDSLDDIDKQKIKKTEGRRIFKFGGGTRLKSEGEYEIPARVAGKDVTIRTDVVKSDIPLLLSRIAMKTAGVKMNLEDDTAEILGKTMNLNLTSSGHYCIPIDKAEMIPVEEVCSVRIDEVDPKKRYSTLLKLHRQFAHPPKKRLVSLLKDAGAWHDSFEPDMEKIEQRCDLCKTYARTPSRPVVSFPMASQFNEKVAMDLKSWRGKWILHMIDMWSRYTVSVFIQRKKTTEVIEKIMSHWIGIFGVMGAIMTDNGGEFNSEEMREVASILNVMVCTSAGESPFQNGLCERVHSVTDMMLTKLEHDYRDVNEQSLLCWANMARNTLQMWNGFSSHQLVFGWNPNLPNIMTDKLPALEGRTLSETFAKHLNLLHGTRRAYIEVEADERIRRALLNKVRAAEQSYTNGDVVYYKREGKDRWLGPGRVVFQDGKVVFVRHGGVFVRVSPNRLQKIKEDCSQSDQQKKSELPETTDSRKERKPDQQETSEQETKSVVTEYFSGSKQEQKSNPSQKSSLALKPNDTIQYKMGLEENKWIKATILGRAGKATANNRHWYNVQDSESREEKSIDLSRLPWERTNQTDENVHSTTCEDKSGDSIHLAKQSELEKLKNFDTYSEEADVGQNRLSTRWVITSKEGQVKARLVARGFEEEFSIPRDSPTVGKGGLKIFLTITASKQWEVKTTDIKSAFLQGKQLDRDVYLQPPKESNTAAGKIWKLKHCLYGLKDGARQFYLSVKEELLKLGFEQCSVDPAVFCLRKDGKLCGIICSHVDDFLHAGDEIFENQICKFRQRFSAGKVAKCQFEYIGFNVKQDQEGIILDHTKYMEKLNNVEIDPLKASQKKTLLSEEEQTAYRQLIGQINWAVQGSRPDLAFEMIDMSTKLKSGTVADLTRASKTINRLKDFKSVLRFSSLDLTTSKLMTFTDASLGNLNDGVGSTQGVIIWIMDKQGKCCPLFWQAKKIKRVVRSTLAAEALSLQEGLEASFYYRHMLEEILGVPNKSIDIYAFVDNKSVIESVHSTKLVEDKRLRIDIAALTESVNQGEVREIKWCSGQKQLANCLTKAGASGLSLLEILQTGQMLPDFVF